MRGLQMMMMKLGLIACALAWATSAHARPTPLGTAFTYQGQLKQGGSPYSGTADISFSIWDSASGGVQVAGSYGFVNVSVSNGTFTIAPDFGAAAFNGEARWLELSVRAPSGSGTFTTLTPRQRLYSTPYALQTRGFFVDAASRVGVGTVAPSAMLSMGPSNANTKFALWDDGSPTTLMGMGIGPNQFRLHLGLPANRFSFLNAPDGFELMTIQGNGLVGISTPFPSNTLTVNGSADITGYLGIGTNLPASALDVRSTFLPQIRFGLPGGSTGQLLAGTNGVVLADNAGNYRLWINQSNGFVGINTTAPDAQLSVNGNATKSGGGSWGSFSDARLKKNITSVHGALEQLMQLRGVTFEYTDPDAINERHGMRIGMLAQEVEQVFPDWVDRGPDGYRILTYRGFEALVVEALRDLRSEKDGQIEELRREKDDQIAAQEAVIAQLLRRVEALEAHAASAHGAP